MGRRPQGEHVLTGAERQARYRTRYSLPLPAPLPTRHRWPTRPRNASRVQRWHAAVGEIVALPAEYAAWLQALPEVTHDSPTGQALHVPRPGEPPLRRVEPGPVTPGARHRALCV